MQQVQLSKNAYDGMEIKRGIVGAICRTNGMDLTDLVIKSSLR